MPEQDAHTKWIAIIVSLIILAMTWISNNVLNLHDAVDQKADKTDANDRWTGSQQDEYRINIQNQIDDTQNEIDRIRNKIQDYEK